MKRFNSILIDSGILFAYYSSNDSYHESVRHWYETYSGELITSLACITEVMYFLKRDNSVQNEFLQDISNEIYRIAPLGFSDFTRITELNKKYADLPCDFADLSLIVISERLNISAIATLDSDFDVYRRYRKDFFERVYFTKTKNT